MSKRAMACTLLGLCAFASGCDEDSVQVSASVSASASVETSPPKKSVTFVPLPVEVGQKWKVERDSKLSVSVEFWAESKRWATVDSLRKEHAVFEDEVLERVGKWPARVKTHYAEYHLEERHPDRGNTDTHSLKGRSFLLDRTEEEPKTGAVDGNPLTEMEEQSLWLHHLSLGKEDALVGQLIRRPFPVGKRVRMWPKLFEGLLGPDVGEFKGGTIGVASIERTQDGEIAVLEWTAKMQTKEKNQMVTDWEMDGKTRVSVRPARLVSQSIDAKLSVSGRTQKDGQWLRMVGDGYMSDERKVTY